MIYIVAVLFLLVVTTLLTIAGAVVEIRNLLRRNLEEEWGRLVQHTFGGRQ